MNIVAQASSVSGSGRSVHEALATCMAVAGTLGAKKSLTVPLTSVPPSVVMLSGLLCAIAGLIERSDQTLPLASVSAITVKKRLGWLPSAALTLSANLSPRLTSTGWSTGVLTFVLPEGSLWQRVLWRSSTPVQD